MPPPPRLVYMQLITVCVHHLVTYWSHSIHAIVCCCCCVCAADPDEGPEGSGSTTSFRRGLSACVFVPWEGVAASPLNLPAKEMDFWLTG
jgi:hypothetical protein